MTQEKLNEANSLSKEIDKLKGLCQFMESKIAIYDFDPPIRDSGFRLYYHSQHEYTFNEAEVKYICSALKIRLKELTDKFDSL